MSKEIKPEPTQEEIINASKIHGGSYTKVDGQRVRTIAPTAERPCKCRDDHSDEVAAEAPKPAQPKIAEILSVKPPALPAPDEDDSFKP